MGLRRLSISAELLVCLFQRKSEESPRFFRITKDVLPDDVRIVSMKTDMEQVQVEIVLESKEWPETREIEEVSPQLTCVEVKHWTAEPTDEDVARIYTKFQERYEGNNCVGRPMPLPTDCRHRPVSQNEVLRLRGQ